MVVPTYIELIVHCQFQCIVGILFWLVPVQGSGCRFCPKDPCSGGCPPTHLRYPLLLGGILLIERILLKGNARTHSDCSCHPARIVAVLGECLLFIIKVCHVVGIFLCIIVLITIHPHMVAYWLVSLHQVQINVPFLRRTGYHLLFAYGTVRILSGGFCSQLGIIPVSMISKVSFLSPSAGAVFSTIRKCPSWTV